MPKANKTIVIRQIALKHLFFCHSKVIKAKQKKANKIKAIINRKAPLNAKDVQIWLGSINFYRKFVEDFEVPKVVISRCYGGSGVNFCFRLKVVCVGMSETEENIIVHVNL